MAKWKAPPKAKVYEALSAVLDGRVRLTGEGEALVDSSSGDKSYTVRWTDNQAIGSNDNASFFQGYIGYPIIAVLLETGRIPFDRELAAPLAAVPWKLLNDRFKRDYDRAVEFVLESKGVLGETRAALVTMVEEVYRALLQLDLDRAAGIAGTPPKRSKK